MHLRDRDGTSEAEKRYVLRRQVLAATAAALVMTTTNGPDLDS
jgi:hypothetical protein